jgi:hypothetical protein
MVKVLLFFRGQVGFIYLVAGAVGPVGNAAVTQVSLSQAVYGASLAGLGEIGLFNVVKRAVDQYFGILPYV